MDLPTFLSLYPWPEPGPPATEPLEWLWHFSLAGCPEDLWPYLIDTSRLNRIVGYDPSTFVEREGMLYGSYDLGGQPVEWAEPPWNWNYARSVGNIRHFTSGMLHTLRTIMHLVPDDANQRTDVFIYLGAIPRNPRWRAAIMGYFAPRQTGYATALRQVEQAAASQADREAVYRPVPLSLDEAAHERLDAIRRTLYAQDQPHELVNRLLTHLTTADEFSLYRIQVVPLAQRWQVPLSALLTLCLHAVREGLLTISWDLICPHCRGARAELSTLAHLPIQGYCTICQTTLDPTNEQALEVLFHVHPAIKLVPRRYFCLGDADAKPHIKIHQRLAPGEQRTLQTALPPGHYRMRVLGEPADGTLHVSDQGPASLRWEATDLPPSQLSQPCPAIQLLNSGPRERVLIVETIGWSASALRPHMLFNLQSFRDVFVQEAIASQVYIDVGTQAIMFTDVVRSTTLYAAQGDAKAFVEIKQYFDQMRAVAMAHGGALIKTLGDGAMLAFNTTSAGWQAALALQQGFAAAPGELALRITLHTGRCLAVTFHTGIDYFGQTVNIAAKLQAIAEAQQIVLSEAAFAEVAAQIVAADCPYQPVVLTNPTLPEPLHAMVITLPSPAARPPLQEQMRGG